MTYKDGKYICDTCNQEIEKGTGFSFPIKDRHEHQTCYYDKTKRAGEITGQKKTAKQNIQDAKDLVANWQRRQIK